MGSKRGIALAARICYAAQALVMIYLFSSIEYIKGPGKKFKTREIYIFFNYYLECRISPFKKSGFEKKLYIKLSKKKKSPKGKPGKKEKLKLWFVT
jgi:hypothetical protein